MFGVGLRLGALTASVISSILDQLDATAAASHSVARLMREEYSGAAIRVRRSSDNTEQDIGLSGGHLDQSALLTFVGAGSGYVRTVYDQTGNGKHWTQTVNAEQGIIVESGELITQNGHPAVRFASGKSFDNSYTFSQPYSVFSVVGRSALISSAYQSLFGGLDYSSTIGTQANTGYISMYAGSVLASTTVMPSILCSLAGLYNGASSKIIKDGVEIASGNAGSQGVTTSWHFNGWGGGGHGDETGDYYFVEDILFTSIPGAADLAQIHSNQTHFYDLGPMTFYKIWGDHWFTRISSNATYTEFGGFSATDYDYDINYSFLTDNSDPLEDIYVAGSWEDRDSGNVWQGQTRFPNATVVPDATSDPYNTPNNPTTILNEDTGVYVCLNGFARPVVGGSLYGYKDDTNPYTHGGSGLIGGEVLQSELDDGVIPHAIALNVWGINYLSNADGGFVAPATKADAEYNNPLHGDYYGGSIENLKMGSRVAIHPDVSAASLGVTSPDALAVFNAAKTYGFIIADNTKGDAIAINCDTDAAVSLEAVQSELVAIYQALRIVE